jgi:hypothetical protein
LAPISNDRKRQEEQRMNAISKKRSASSIKKISNSNQRYRCALSSPERQSLMIPGKGRLAGIVVPLPQVATLPGVRRLESLSWAEAC